MMVAGDSQLVYVEDIQEDTSLKFFCDIRIIRWSNSEDTGNIIDTRDTGNEKIMGGCLWDVC